MPPSRRRLLRASALSFAALAGCSMVGETPTPDRDSTTATTETTPEDTATPEPTDTPDPRPLTCDPGPLPEAGWPLPDRSTGRTNYAPAADGPTEKPSAEWTVTAERPEVGEVQFTRPVVSDGRLFVGRRIIPGTSQPAPDEQHVDCYDAATGERRWRTPVADRPWTPTVVRDGVLAHDSTTLYAVEADTGAERWTYEPPGSIVSVLPTDDGILVASNGRDGDHEVVALESGGDVDWRVTVPGRMNSELAWADGRASVVTEAAALVAIDTAEEAVTWTRDLQDDDDTAPAALAAMPCGVIAAIDGVLYAVHSSGNLAWSTDAGVRQLATDGDHIYGLNGDGYVRRVAVADGEAGWEQFAGVENPRKTDGFFGDPAVDGDTLYAGSIDEKLLAVSTDDGSERWVLEGDWRDGASVTVADGTLYAGWGRQLVAFQ